MPTLTTTAPTISSTGITAPAYADILSYLVSQYQAIFGADTYLDPSTQDYQFLAIQARCISDTNSAVIAAYNAFSPATAQGAGLSSVVKINGITRAVPSYSTVDLTIAGSVGTVITNGVVAGSSGIRWNLPPSVTIPSSGSIVATATAQALGAISLGANAVWTILTPTLGWTSVTNANPSAPGNPVESDAALRLRQSSSVALPSLSILDGLVGALKGLPGITRLAAYENPTSSTTPDGRPPYSLALVVEGGDSQTVANTIAAKKGVGVNTYGSTSLTVTEAYGTPTISFSRPTQTAVTVAITLHALTGYTTVIGASVAAAVASYINSLPIGSNMQLTKLYLPANLYGAANSATYEITALTINGGSSDVTIGLMNVAYCNPSSGVNITAA